VVEDVRSMVRPTVAHSAVHTEIKGEETGSGGAEEGTMVVMV
jgi:hypothetical protein